MRSSFSGRRSTLETSIVIWHGRRSTLDVSCCVFCANLIVRAASSGDKVQIAWQAWHFVRCAENGRKPRTKHRFWGSKFCSWENSKENVDFEATKCKIWRKSRTKCLYWGSSMSRLDSLVCFCRRVSKPLLFEGIKAGCNAVLRCRRGTSWHFHVSANAWKIVLCDRHNTFTRLSADEFQF